MLTGLSVGFLSPTGVGFSEFVGYKYPTYYFSCFFNNTEASIR